MLSLYHPTIDGYSYISNIDVASLHQWWKALLLVLSNFFAIPAIIISIRLGGYLWSYSLLISMIVSIFYHLCQCTDYCVFITNLDSYQRIDHVSAGIILAMSLLLFYIYRPSKTHKLHKYYKPKLKYNYGNDFLIDIHEEHHKRKHIRLGPKNSLYFDDDLSPSSKNKVCFSCRGVNPLMVYDGQSIFIVITYIFVVVFTIYAIPLTTQSFLIIILFGVLFALIKIFVIEEGNPEYLENRFDFKNLLIGVILIIISLIFYFIDAYMAYWLFHSLWHLSFNIGALFLFLGVTRDVDGWFDSSDIFKYIWMKIKHSFKIFNCCRHCTCCKKKKKKILVTSDDDDNSFDDNELTTIVFHKDSYKQKKNYK